MLKFSEYLTVIFASTIKFIGGPIAGITFNLKWYEIAICCVLGMMSSVVFVMFGKEVLMKILYKLNLARKKKIFSKTSRLAVKVKSKLGLPGIAFLTPILFTPILGAIVAVEFRYAKFPIFYFMLISAIFWGILLSLAAVTLKEQF